MGVWGYARDAMGAHALGHTHVDAAGIACNKSHTIRPRLGQGVFDPLQVELLLPTINSRPRPYECIQGSTWQLLFMAKIRAAAVLDAV